MIDGSTPAGTRIRCINRQGQSFLTLGKIYEVVPVPDGPAQKRPHLFWFYDDDSELMYSEYEYGEFELVEEPL